MSVLKNNLYSSSADLSAGTAYENMQYSDNAYYKKARDKNINNNLERSDFMRKAKLKHESQSSYLFWSLVALLLILAIGNLILTFTILGVLRLGQGMESLELVSEESLIKFYGETDLDRILKMDGKIESFFDSPLHVIADGNSFHVGIVDTERHMTPSLNVEVDQAIVKNINSFEVKHPVSGKSIFSTNFPNFGLPSGVAKLNVNTVLTKRISSPVDEGLTIRSEKFTFVKGAEGAHMDGREIIWYADQDVYLKSVNKSIILNGREGILVDVRSLPVATGLTSEPLRQNTQYKICVCMPQGKLFRVPVPPEATHIGCQLIDLTSNHNPCI